MADTVPMPPDIEATVSNDFATQVHREIALSSADIVPDPPDIDEAPEQYEGRTPEQMYSQMNGQKLDGWAEYLSSQWELGASDVKQGIMFSPVTAGLAQYEDVEQQLAEDTTRAKDLGAKTSIFESEHFWVPPAPSNKNTPEWRDRSAKWFANFVQGIPGAMMRSAAFTGSILAGGGAAGLVTGGAGFGIGAFNMSGQIMAGLAYRDMRRQNVPHERAQKLAIASGMIQAAIENIQVGQLLRMGKSAYVKAINTPAARATIRGTVLRFTYDNGMQANEEYLQEWTQVITEYLGKLDRLRLPTKAEWNEAVARTNAAYVQGWQGAIGQTTTAKGVGKALGGAARVLDGKRNPTEIDFGKAITAEIQYEQNQQKVVTGRVLSEAEARQTEAVQPKESETTQQAKEQLENATDMRVKAQQHLETVLYEIEVAKEETGETPKGLIEKRKQANRDLKDAQYREKKAKLKVAKSEAQDVINTRGIDADVKKAAVEELAHVEKKRDETNKQIARDKREQVETDLKAQIELLEQEFQKVSANDVEATHNIAKQLHNAELKLQLLQSGLLSKELENSLIDSERNSIIKRSVGDLAFSAFVRAWNIARRTKNIVTEGALKNRQLLADIVKNSGLTPQEQGQFLTFVKNGVLTDATLEKLDRRIQAIINKRETKKAREDLVSTLKNVNREKVAPNKASVPIHIQAILSAYQQMSELSVDELEAIAQQEVVTGEDLEPGAVSTYAQVVIANDLLNVLDKNASVETINALTDKLEQIHKTGKAEQFDVEEKRKAAASKAVVRARAIIRGRRYRKKLNDVNAFVRTIALTKRLGFTRGLFNLWQTHLATLSQHAATDEMYAEFNEMLSLDKEGRERRANSSRFIRAMLDHVLIRDGQSKRDGKLKKLIVRGARKQKRRGFRDPISDNELIQLWMQTQDSILAPRIKATYRTSATNLQARIESMLSEDQLYMAERLQEFYQQYYERINEHHIKEFGYALRHNKEYSGMAVGEDMDLDATPQSAFLQALAEHRSILPSSVRRRTSNLNKLRTVDAFTNAINHIEDMESWRAFSEKARLLQSVFENEHMKQDIMDKFGSEYYTRIRRAYRRIIGLEAMPRTSLDSYLNSIRGNYAMFMAGKLEQYAKQATGLIIYRKYLSHSELMQGMEHYLHNFETANARLRETDFFEDRKYNVTPETRAAIGGSANALEGGLSGTMQKLLLLPVSQTDTAVNSIGMWAIYQKGLKAGLSDQEAMAFAERAAEESQSSAGEHHKSSLELETGSVGQLVSTLSKQNVQVSNLSTSAWRRAISHPTPKNILNALNTSMALHLSQAAFMGISAGIKVAGLIALTSFGFMEDDDDEKLNQLVNNAITDFVDNMLFGAHLGLPVIGALGKMLLTNQWNTLFPDLDKRTFAPSIPGLDAATDLAELEADLQKTGASDVPIDAVDIGNLWTDFNESGLPLVPFKEVIGVSRVMIGLNSFLKTLVWLNTDSEWEAEKKELRRDREE